MLSHHTKDNAALREISSNSWEESLHAHIGDDSSTLALPGCGVRTDYQQRIDHNAWNTGHNKFQLDDGSVNNSILDDHSGSIHDRNQFQRSRWKQRRNHRHSDHYRSCGHRQQQLDDRQYRRISEHDSGDHGQR